MRLLQQEADEYDAAHHFRNSPVPPSTAENTAAPPPLEHRCFPRNGGCPWWPYSSARDFKANTALVLIILFSAFVCAIAFNAALRYLLRRRRRRMRRRSQGDNEKADAGSKKAEDEEGGVTVPTVIFSAASAAEDGGGGVVASEECTICLGEFVEGERVRVLENCKHCFHIQCIQRWLYAHSSCPTCRAASH